MVHVGVGTGVSREILSQVPKFTLNRGEMPLADDSDKKVEDGIASESRDDCRRVTEHMCGHRGVTTYNSRASTGMGHRPAKVRQEL